MAQPYDYLNYQYPTSNPMSGSGMNWQNDPTAGAAIGSTGKQWQPQSTSDFGMSTSQGMGNQQYGGFGLSTTQGMGQQYSTQGMQRSGAMGMGQANMQGSNQQYGGFGLSTDQGMGQQYSTQAIPERMYQPGAMPAGGGGAAPTPGQWNSGAPALNYSQGFSNPYGGLDPNAWRDPKDQAGAQAWSSTQLPYQQLQQNAWQYTSDFNEAQRRWNEQMQWQQASDQFNMQNTSRQQQMAEWQANEAARQWGAQFGYQQETDRFSQDLANRQLGWTQEQGRGELGNQKYATDVELQLGQGRNANERAQIAIQDWYNQQRAATEKQQVTGSLANEGRSIDVQDWYNRSRASTDQAAVDVDRLWKTGQLTNQQREMALAELTQGQNENFRQAQMAQEGALQREQMANSQKIAAMQTFGRAQMPNARYIRSWA
jgi:hypothetical protein